MRTRILTRALPLLCSGALLAACGSPYLRPEAPRAAVAAADDHYLRGRNLHLARRYEDAIAAYQQALQADATHVNARNGLATAYAEQRDFAHAIPIWRELTRGATMASGAGTAFLFGNLGHAYFLNGQYDEALVSLEKACLLDPLNHRTWQRLGETLQQLGQDERARQMLRQASALREHDFRSDYAAVDGGARLPAIEQAVKAPQRPDQDWAFVEVTTRANGMLELRRVVPSRGPSPAPAPAPAPVTRLPAPPLPKENRDPLIVAALEISNGNGRQGLARLMSRQLHDAGLKVVRLTNEKGFAVRQTRIEYQPAFRGVAERLAERLAERFGAGTPVEVSKAGRANVRLVIGRDLSAGSIASRTRAMPAGQASAAGAP